jgi:hypothetical protein
MANGSNPCDRFPTGFITIDSLITEYSFSINVDTINAIADTIPLLIYSYSFNELSICSNVGIHEPELKTSIHIFPNPAQDHFTVTAAGLIRIGRVIIYNVLGEIIYEENILHESKKEITLKNVSEGIYFLKLFDGEKSYCKKLIIAGN